MIRKTGCKKILCMLLTMLLLLGLAAPASGSMVFAASSFSDVYGHWAGDYINDAVRRGVVKGYPDGTFKPDAAVTRAEFLSMINKALENDGLSSINFNDVPRNEWFYNDVSKAVSAAYVSGYSNGSFKPNNSITREEAAVIISRIVPSYGSNGNLKTFKDVESISDWAYAAFQKVNGKGYLGAYDDGRLHPQDSLTRAQTAKIICSIISGETIDSSKPVIRKSSEKLSNVIYSNGLTVSKELGENSVTIDNCVVMGELSIQGGGSESVGINNSRVAYCSIAKLSSSVRVFITGETVICNADADETCRLEAAKLAGGLYGTGFGNVNVKASSDVTFKGDFPKISVTGNSAVLRIESGKIGILNVERNSRNAEINSDSGATIDTANVDGASAAFLGKGTINNMIVNASGVTYETKPKSWKLGSEGSSPTYSDASLSVTFSPKDGAKNVSLNTKITLTFNSIVTDRNGKKLSAANIADAVELRRKSSSGTKLDFSVDISSSKKVFTLTPKAELESDTKYYILIPKNTFMNENTEILPAESSYFTTGDSNSDSNVSFSPRNGETGVGVNVAPTISFSESMQTYAGKNLTESYIEGNVEIREGSSSGGKVAFTASFNSSRTRLYLSPRSALKENQKYYVGIPAKIFRTVKEEIPLSASSVIWNTSYITPSVSGLTASAGESSITVSVTPNMSGTVYAVLVPSGAAAPNSDQVVAGKNGGNTAVASKNASASAGQAVQLSAFTGLPYSTGYTVYAVVKTGNGTSAVSSKAVSTTAPLIAPALLSGITITGDKGDGVLVPGFSGNTTKYNVRMPHGSTKATITGTGGAGINVFVKVGSGSYGPGLESSNSIADMPLDNTGSNTVTLKSTGDRKSNTEYELNIVVSGNPGLADISAGSGATSVGHQFIMPAGSTTATLTITSSDPSATVSCSQISPSSSTGILTGTVPLNGTVPVQLDITIRSNGDSASYSYSIRAADAAPPVDPATPPAIVPR